MYGDYYSYMPHKLESVLLIARELLDMLFRTMSAFPLANIMVRHHATAGCMQVLVWLPDQLCCEENCESSCMQAMSIPM